MTVKECVLETATLVGVGGSVKDYVDNVSEEGLEEARTLIRCFNHVENELALDYLPLLFEEEFQTETGVVYYSQLQRAAVRVLAVTDGWGNEVPFTLFPEYVKTQAGKIRIRYSYTPEEKAIGDESDFVLYASKRLFCCGMAAEYCIASGLYEEAAVWDKKYKDAIKAAYRLQSSKKLRSRRWV